jgi:soluble calcium-activated nucleotidase 1
MIMIMIDFRSIGYVKHESGGWSDKLGRWVFLPRRACKEAFTTDERMGTNALILATENFDSIEVNLSCREPGSINY